MLVTLTLISTFRDTIDLSTRKLLHFELVAYSQPIADVYRTSSTQQKAPLAVYDSRYNDLRERAKYLDAWKNSMENQLRLERANSYFKSSGLVVQLIGSNVNRSSLEIQSSDRVFTLMTTTGVLVGKIGWDGVFYLDGDVSKLRARGIEVSIVD